jgi:hypothetical protein
MRDGHEVGRRSSFDVMDLVLGIGLALVLPLLAAFGAQLMRDQSERELASYRRNLDVGTPAPDEEEVRLNLESCRRMYAENGQKFLERAREAQSFQQLKECAWARRCLSQIKTELGLLEGMIRDGHVEERYQAQLVECQRLREQIELDLRTLKQMDIFGRQE